MGTAEFLKPPGIDTKGYESGLNKQWISLNKYATVGLRGAGPTGERLTVSLNNPAIGTIAEQAPQTNLRILRVTGKTIGHAMMEAKSRSGQVVAFIAGLLSETVRRSPFGPAQARRSPLVFQLGRLGPRLQPKRAGRGAWPEPATAWFGAS